MKQFFFRKRNKDNTQMSPEYGWFGNFPSWEAVSHICGGYHQANILEKTKSALLKVRDGEAVYERDAVLFKKKQYPFQLIACLLYLASKRKNKLRVIDFGGSLGSTYFQVKEFLTELDLLSWHVVEQPAYIEVGRENFENEELKFYYTLQESLQHERPDVIILSSVVQYLEKPHTFLEELATYQIEHILFDRTAFVLQGSDRLTIQRVPPEIYDASYPAWFFNEQTFMAHFMQYAIRAEFTSYVPGESDLRIDNEIAGVDKGFFLEHKSPLHL